MTLENVMKEIRKQFGEMSILKLGDAARRDVEAVSTGALGLDLALGVGGLPKGRIIELYGHESSGKTTLALHAVANVQKAGGTAAFIDAEHALDPGYAKKIGVDLAGLVVSQPSSGEEALTICEELVKSGAVDIVVMRKLTAAIAQTKTLCIFTNQVRDKIGVMFGNPETTPGGKALKFYASCRLQVQRIGAIKSVAGEVIGNRTRVKVVKNKVASPFTEAEFDILYSCGISWEGSVLDAALARGVVERRGSWLAFGVACGDCILARQSRLDRKDCRACQDDTSRPRQGQSNEESGMKIRTNLQCKTSRLFKNILFQSAMSTQYWIATWL